MEHDPINDVTEVTGHEDPPDIDPTPCDPDDDPETVTDPDIGDMPDDLPRESYYGDRDDTDGADDHPGEYSEPGAVA